MKIGPLFKWFGSKWGSAKHYPKPISDTICEPFAGSAGYSLNYCNLKIHIYDDDPRLRKLWLWLINEATSDKIKEIPCNIPIGTDIRKIGMTHGQELLLKHWQRTNNVGGCWTISPWGHMPGFWNNNTRDRIAEDIYKIKHWKFTKPISLIDNEMITWFIDPPYQFNYRYNCKLPPFNYSNLDSFVQTLHRSSLVIVCEAIGSMGEMPTYLNFKESHNQITSRRKKGQNTHSKELVYIRNPS